MSFFLVFFFFVIAGFAVPLLGERVRERERERGGGGGGGRETETGREPREEGGLLFTFMNQFLSSLFCYCHHRALLFWYQCQIDVH